MPRLTILIPTLNRAMLVGRAIDSALAQTCPDIEIIVSDNGSSDGTPQLLSCYCDPRLRMLRRETTIPAWAHGNLLLKEARGELLLGLSDDDYLEPEFAARMIDLFDRHPQISFAYSGCWMHYWDVVVPARTGPELESGNDFIAAFLGGARDVCWCACVTRTAALRRIGPIPPDTIFGDMFYWTKLAFEGDVGCIREPLSHYVAFRDVGDNITGGTPATAWARETSSLAKDLVAGYLRTASDAESARRVQRDGKKFVARSVANQLIWNVLRGTGRIATICAIRSNLAVLRHGGLALWLRAMVSFVVPKRLLRQQVLLAARRAARMR